MDFKVAGDLLTLTDAELDDLLQRHRAEMDAINDRITLLSRIKDQRTITAERDRLLGAVQPDSLTAMSKVEPLEVPSEPVRDAAPVVAVTIDLPAEAEVV